MSLDTTDRIQQLRQKAQLGELTIEETKEAINLMRQGRVSAAQTSAKSRSKKAAAAPVDSDALLNQLEGL